MNMQIHSNQNYTKVFLIQKTKTQTQKSYEYANTLKSKLYKGFSYSEHKNTNTEKLWICKYTQIKTYLIQNTKHKHRTVMNMQTHSNQNYSNVFLVKNTNTENTNIRKVNQVHFKVFPS